MENFWLSVHIVLPIFLMMGTGYAARRLRWIDAKGVRAMNGIVFKVFLPVLLCNNIRKASLEHIGNGAAYLYTAAGLCVLFALSMLLMPRVCKDGRRTGVLVQGICRANYALFGLPLVAAMFPNGDTSAASLMVAATVPFYNALSVVALEMYRGGKVAPSRMLLSIAKNPLIIGCAAGMALWALGAELPGYLDSAMNDMGRAATPVALFVLGASFSFGAVRGNGKALFFATAMKLLIVPAVFVGGAVALGIREVPLAAVLIAFGAPTAVSSFTMAQQMDADDALAGQIVVITTLCSMVSMVAFIFLFRQMGWITCG